MPDHQIPRSPFSCERLCRLLEGHRDPGTLALDPACEALGCIDPRTARKHIAAVVSAVQEKLPVLASVLVAGGLGLLPRLRAFPLSLALLMAFAFAIDRILIVGILGLDRGFSIALYTMFLLSPPFVIPIFMPGAAGIDQAAGTAEIRAGATGATEDREFVVNAISLGVIVSLAAFVALNLAIRVGFPV